MAATLEEIRALLGGSKNSTHMLGLAADLSAPGFGSVLQVAKKIAASGIAYDQVIYEFSSWVHVGLRNEAPRREKLSIFNGTGYLPGILSKPPVG